MIARRALSLAAGLVPTGLAFPIVRGPLRGTRWITGAAAGEAKGLSVLVNASEPEQLACAAAEVTPGDVCFDVGANVGMYTALFARRAREVVAFEPFARNVAYLHRLVALNRFERVTIVPLAAGEGSGLASFSAGRNVAEGRLSGEGTIPVGVVSLDEFVARFGTAPTFMKIDVEGAEAEVLRGARSLLSARRPRLLLSTHGDAVRDECLSLLAGFGYTGVRALNASRSEFFVTP